MPSVDQIESLYGPQADDDSVFRRRCRLLQSWYRVEVLRERRCGPWRKGGRIVGSSLVDGETTGANFLTPTAFAYARSKVLDKQSTPELTIDEFRLYNNMLSSMPMCFNLFSDLRAAVVTEGAPASAILAAMFAEAGIATVTSVEVEMLPRPISHYTNDRTAFDAGILFNDAAGRQGLVAIETKYTDPLGKNRASDEALKLDVATRLELFTPAGLDHYRAVGFDQIARNLLLAHAYGLRHGLATVRSYVLAPQDDKEAVAAVAELRDLLADQHKADVIELPLETLVARALAVAHPPHSEHLIRFRQRYLDFSPIQHLCGH